MNLKKVLSITAVIGIMILGACGDDEPSRKEQFAFEGKTFGLKEANFYLTDVSTYDGRQYREYLITDGEYTDGFEGSTYFIEVEFADEVDEDDFETGKFPQWYSWDDVPETSAMSYLEAWSESEGDADYFYFWTPEEAQNDDHDPIVISGGINDDQTMTLKFDGTLMYEYYDTDTEEYIEELASGKFYVKGKVEDISNLGGPAKRKSKRELRAH